MDLENCSVVLLHVLWRLLSQADLVGSRGRARRYGRPDPEGVDWDWSIFVDDRTEKEQARWWLHILVEDYGFKGREREGGHFTASGLEMDISTNPLWKIEWTGRVWTLKEQGYSKEQAYAWA